MLQAGGKRYIRQGQEGFEFVKVASIPVEHIVRVIKIVMYDGRIGRNQFFVQTNRFENPQREAVVLAVEEIYQYGDLAASSKF